MRVSSALAILILGAGVAPSVALPLRALPKIPQARPHKPLPVPPAPAPRPLPKPPSAVPPPPPSSPALNSLLSQPPHSSPPSPLSPLSVSFIPPPPNIPSVPTKLKKLEPLRGTANPVEPAPVQKSTMQKLVGKLWGRALIANSDEVVGQPYSRRELLGHFDELIMLAARAYEYERELLTTPMDNLD